MAVSEAIGDEPRIGFRHEPRDGFVGVMTTSSFHMRYNGAVSLLGFDRINTMEPLMAVAFLNPCCQVVATVGDLIIDAANANQGAGLGLLIQPAPKCWTEIEAVVPVLGLNEGV